MKVILAAPNYHQIRGNRVTVDRIRNSLVNRGVEVVVVSSTDKELDLSSLHGDIYHGFHAHYFYDMVRRNKRSFVPYVLTLTGTDFNHDIHDPDRRALVMETIDGAEAIHVFNEESEQRLLEEMPHVKNKVYIIPQAVSEFPKRETSFLKKKEGSFLFILPAGIRKVKNVPVAMTMLAKLRKKYQQIELWIMGPVIEEDEGNRVKELVDKHHNWVTYAHEIAHEEMGAIFEQGDVVINTSISEGQPSSILEAMSLGIPTLVSSNVGNRSLVTHRENGLIYQTELEFLSFAEKLILEDELRRELGKNSIEYIRAEHSSEKEIDMIHNIYKKVAGTR